MTALDCVLLALLGLWLGAALRSAFRRKGGCGGECARCGGCRRPLPKQGRQAAEGKRIF